MNIYDFTVKAQDGSEVALSQFAGKAIVPFCTSGGSGVEGSVARITELTAGKATAHRRRCRRRGSQRPDLQIKVNAKWKKNMKFCGCKTSFASRFMLHPGRL